MLKIASQKKEILNFPDTTSKARKWVDDLPTGNFGEMTRRIFVCLSDLNKNQLPHINRIEVTEVIRPFAEMALDNLQKHLQARSFPLPERSRKIFELNQSLLLEMAGAYQLSALDMLTKGKVNNKYLLQTIGRALNYMGRVLINTYGVYVHPREALWRDIHHLYLLACEHKIDKLNIPDRAPVEYSCSTIEDYYKHISLLALAKPYTIRLGEINRLDKFFRATLALVHVHTNPENIDGKYAHIAMLNSDEPPSLMPVAELLNSPTVRLFDIATIIKQLKKFEQDTQHASLGTNETFPMLTNSLAKRMILAMTLVRNRRFKRFPRDEKTPVVSHLSNIIRVVRIEQEHDNDSAAYDEDEMFEELIYGENSSASSPWAVTDAKTQLEQSDIDLKVWQIENSCSEGYGLVWKNKDESGVRVGELVALQDPSDDSGKWQIGTIRWMEMIDGKGLLSGVELLSPRALPIQIKEVKNRSISQKLPVDGLLLPRIEGLKDTAYLLLPDYMFRLNDKLTMKISNREENIEITKIDEGKGAFAICEYYTDVEEEVVETVDDTFNEIWGAL